MRATRAHERTDPFWVQTNGRTDAIIHRHELFGTPVMRYRLVLGDDGKPLMRQAVRTVRIANALDPFSPSNTSQSYAAAKLARSRGAALSDTIDLPTGVYLPVRERVVVGHYIDHCTAGELADKHGASLDDPSLFLPCTGTLLRHEWRRAFARGHSDDSRRGPARNSVRQHNRALARLANSQQLDESA